MYAKVFRQIFESSIAENPSVRFTFMDLLVLADPNGVVDMTHESIARITNRPLSEIQETILILESADPQSRTADENGARIKRLDDHRNWGWIIINYDRFRQIASEDQRREKTRERVKRFRSTRKEPCNAPVTQCNAGNAMQKQREMQRHKHKEGEERTELPHNFPKSPDDALKQCEGSLCMDCAFITKLYNSAMSKLGKDGNGQPILSFRHYVAKHWPGEVSRREEMKVSGNGVSGADKIVFGKEYERVLQALKDLKAGYGDHQDMDQADRTKLKSLVARRNELRTTLHITI